ncbi:hypothetical protein [Methylobacterium gregans]
MATEKKLKDPAEAALSAIEQALNLDALTPPEPMRGPSRGCRMWAIPSP